MNAFDAWFFARYAGDDELYDVYHRHIFSILDDVFVWLFFTVLAPFYAYYTNLFNITAYVDTTVVSCGLIGVYLLLMYRIFDWYNDVWILTSEGLIDLDWSLFGKRTQQIEYHDISGLEVAEGGMFDSFIGRADVILRTHAEGTEFELAGARHPYEIVEWIQEAVDHHRLPEPEPELSPFEKLLSTLEDVVREHLNKNDAKTETTEPEDEAIAELLSRKGTIDLRPKKQLPIEDEDDVFEEEHNDHHAHAAQKPAATHGSHDDHGHDHRAH